jgi:hypothetical protein
MKCLPGVLAAVFLLMLTGASHALVRIANDRGGQIGRYIDGYEQAIQAGWFPSLRPKAEHQMSDRRQAKRSPIEAEGP